MQVWLLCFGVLFAVAQLILWLKEIMLPLPLYILAGAFLAIASNYSSRTKLLLPGANENQSISGSSNQATDNTN